ncbi:MAG: hypothetical protein RR738_01770 [Anaerorhabdus sp.]|uniref:hypothetical protein n=1 Tax=Anaerorhabdus sp. TaxID=1872524 RepID=UPI002FC6DAB1
MKICNTIKERGNNLFKYMCAVFFGIFVGFILINFVYLIPTEPLKKNISSSAIYTGEENLHPQVVDGYVNSTLDLLTDYVMLNTAVNKSDKPFYEAAMSSNNIYYNENNQDVAQNLIDYCDEKSDYLTTSYERYWHGYLVFLKPLLIFFNIQDITMLNFTTQLILFSILIYFISKTNGLLCSICFAIVSSFIGFPLITGMNLQYTSIILISLISSIILLWKKEWLFEDKIRLNIMFLVVGMMTSYMDFLTFPTLTLTLPLILFILNLKLCNKEKIVYVFKLSLFWVFGYILMWGSKWLLASIILNQNVFKNAIDSILLRTSIDNPFNSSEKFSRIFSIKKTLIDVYLRKPTVLFALSFIFFSMQKYLRKLGLKKYLIVLKENLILLFIGLIPLVFIFLSANHAIVHFYFVNKQLFTTIIAVLLFFNVNER